MISNLRATIEKSALITITAMLAAHCFTQLTGKGEARAANFHQTKSPPPSQDGRNKILAFREASHRGGADSATSPQKNSLPALIAHRGGTTDFPENTLLAIESSLANHVQGVWLSVQLSRDGVPILYRPADLATLTNEKGPTSSKTAAELAKINAGWHFQRSESGSTYPYRKEPIGIPTLAAALEKIPHNIWVILDMKALPAKPQVEAVKRVLNEKKAWSRILIYSTDASYQKEFASYPQSRNHLFESRDTTRQRAFNVLLNARCERPPTGTIAGFELNRSVKIVESFMLGEGQSNFDVRIWTQATVDCFRQGQAVALVAFGVNDESAYREAARLNINAVLVDSPKEMHRVKTSLKVKGLLNNARAPYPEQPKTDAAPSPQHKPKSQLPNDCN
jgi:glycerophosphoryl diester phosphodiesterase